MRPLKVVGDEMKVTLCRRDLRVTQDQCEAHNVSTVPKVTRRHRVSQSMPPETRQPEMILKHIE